MIPAAIITPEYLLSPTVYAPTSPKKNEDPFMYGNPFKGGHTLVESPKMKGNEDDKKSVKAFLLQVEETCQVN